MKKLFLFMSWVMLILSGCADEDIIERNSPSFPQSVNTRSAGDGVYDILGYGYDITGPYLDTKSSRAIVFDTNKLLEKGLITPYKLEESRFRYSSGKDVIDFTTNMSSSLQMSTPGILKVIGGASLNIAFGGNSHYNSDYSFAYCTQQYIDSRYRISEADINVLKTCLTKQFIERLSTYTPEQIVEEYGTHVLKDIYLGAKFEVYYMAKSTSSSKKESINAGLGASLFSLFKMDGKFQYDESLAITNKEQSLYYFTIGGDPAVGVQGSLNPENSPSIDIGKWMASVKSSTPKFIDVDNNSQSFIPIYELVTDPTKKQTLKAYIDNYIKSKEVCSISLYPSTTGTRQVSGLGHINQGAGVAIGDIDKNGRPDMILMGIDNPKGKNNFWYKVLYDIDENGYYSKESSILSISAEGWENSGGDIALCDLNNNGILDMVLLCTDKPTTAGRAYRWYYVAYDLKPDGHYNSLSSLNTLDEKQADNKYGSKFYATLSRDLRHEMPDVEGLSETSIRYAKRFYTLYNQQVAILPQVVEESEKENLPQLVERLYSDLFSIPWGHHRYIIDKCSNDSSKALFYVRQTLENGWSRDILLNMLGTNLYERSGKALTNFKNTLPDVDSDLAQELTRDPYDFSFTGLRGKYNERKLKDTLLTNITNFLLELGTGFAYVGKEYRLQIAEKEKFIDLLFYNLRLSCYVVVEVKIGEFDFADAGQLGGYVVACNHLLRKEGRDNPTIGLLICKQKNNTLAQYALESSSQPLGISEYELEKLYPEKVEGTMPSIKEIEDKLDGQTNC